MDEPVDSAYDGGACGLDAEARPHAAPVQPVGRGDAPVLTLVDNRQGLIAGAPGPLELDLEVATRRLHYQDNRTQRVFDE